MRFTGPATSPFAAASQVASFRATLRVRLLSRPHARHAPITASDGHGSATSTEPLQLSTAAPAMIAAMPRSTRRSTFSRNTTQASTAVNTPSRFSSSEAPDAGMPARPIINSTGATTPPLMIPPSSGSSSCGARRTRVERRASR